MNNNTETSFIKAAISINKTELEQFINTKIPSVLYDNTAKGGDKGVFIRAMKTGSINIDATGNTLKYSVPLKINVKKDIAISTAEAQCSMILGMETQFAFNEDWSLRTKTELKEYKWLEKPVLNVGFLSFPVETIILNALDSKKDMITSALDKLVQQVNLNKLLHDLLAYIPNPVETNIADNIWWKASNVTSYLGPLSVSNNTIKVIVGLKANPKISIGRSMEISPLKVKGPSQVDKLPQLSNLNLVGGIAIKTIEKIALSQLKDKDFSSGKYTIKVEDAKLTSDGTHLYADVALSGSFDGTAKVKAIPLYDKSIKEIYFSDIDLDLVGDDIVNKGIALVAEGTVKDKMKDALRFPIKKLHELINKNVKNQEIQPGIFVKGYLSDIDLDNVKLSQDALDLEIKLGGIVSLIVEKINVPERPMA